MSPRRGTRGLRSSRGLLLAPPFRISWPRGCHQEEEQEDSEVPEGCCWRHPSGYHGQEEPEARGQEGSEGAGRESCQGRQEADRFQEGPVWRQEGTEGSEGAGRESCQGRQEADRFQ